MKTTGIFSLTLIFMLMSCSTQQTVEDTATAPGGNKNNNLLFDNEDTNLLESPGTIRISGEVKEELSIRLSDLEMRSVVVKEVMAEEGERVFKGAFRYDGYSLEDLLANVELDKNSGFDPITDLYIKVHGNDGTYSVVSWGEIFFPVHHHLQIIAVRVARHVPEKTPDVQYELPGAAKLVVSNDLLTYRNISNPISIEICSCEGDFPEEEMEELFWPTLTLKGFNGEPVVLEELPDILPERESDLIFYGRGRGIHDVNPFDGCYLSELLETYVSPDPGLIQKGFLVASAPDGYRSVFSLSEIMNRNDRLETLIIDEENFERAGRFSLIVTGDFFSDRAMKALSQLELMKD